MLNRLPLSVLLVLLLVMIAGAVGLGIWWWNLGGLYGNILIPVVSAETASPPEPGLTITTDPGIELLAVVQYLSGYDQRLHLLTRFNSTYKQDVEATFGRYRERPPRAVQIFDRMSQRSFSFDAPPSTMLYFSDPPRLEAEIALPEALIQRGGGRSQMGEFISDLRDFARKTQFADFYKQHQSFYEDIAADVAALTDGNNELALMESYYGMRQHSYTIILAPLFHPGGYGPNVAQSDGSYDIYSIIGPSGLNEQGQPVFGTPESLRRLVWHEFGHSFVNPLTGQHYRADLMKYESLYEPIKEPMKKQAYTNWQTTVNEHIVRAVVIRLTEQTLGEEQARAALQSEHERGFVYIDGLIERLKEYESRRVKYPTFADFYPRLVEAFGEEIK